MKIARQTRTHQRRVEVARMVGGQNHAARPGHMIRAINAPAELGREQHAKKTPPQPVGPIHVPPSRDRISDSSNSLV